MDDRKNLPPGQVDPGQIREGAGLEDSRINQDFVDLLKKFSTPALLILVIAAASYYGLSQYRESQVRALDAAFVELDEAQRAGSPDGLIAVANAHEGQRGVSTLARLRAADIHLGAARTRIAVAAPMNPDGTPQNESDLLTEEQRTDQLDQAARLYQRIVDGARTDSGAGANITVINAMFGLAAVAETRGEMDSAASWYTRIAERAGAAGLTRLERVAKERKDTLDRVAQAPALYATAQLPAPPAPAMDPNMPQIMGADGQPLNIQRVDGPPGPILPGVGIPGDVPDQPVMPKQPGELDDGIPLAPGSSGG